MDAFKHEQQFKHDETTVTATSHVCDPMPDPVGSAWSRGEMLLDHTADELNAVAGKR